MLLILARNTLMLILLKMTRYSKNNSMEERLATSSHPSLCEGQWVPVLVPRHPTRTPIFISRDVVKISKEKFNSDLTNRPYQIFRSFPPNKCKPRVSRRGWCQLKQTQHPSLRTVKAASTMTSSRLRNATLSSSSLFWEANNVNQIIQHPVPSAEPRLQLRKKQKDTVQLVNSLASSQAVWRGALLKSHYFSLLEKNPRVVNATLAKRGQLDFAIIHFWR